MSDNIFRRIEKKYQPDNMKRQQLMERIGPYIHPDAHGESTVRNIYFDTDNYDVIRDSLEMPVYKEKLRIRCYGELTDESTVYFEIKKKYDHVVHKRREPMKFGRLKQYLREGLAPDIDCQIMREIDYVRRLYNLKPKVMLAYDRIAFFGNNNPDFRVSFDNNIRCHRIDENFNQIGPEMITLGTDRSILEIKTEGGWPLWLARPMSELQIFHKRYSKYGEYYKQELYKDVVKGKAAEPKKLAKAENPARAAEPFVAAKPEDMAGTESPATIIAKAV